jgi:FMN phosphatase YigB (HAD superfamily)
VSRTTEKSLSITLESPVHTLLVDLDGTLLGNRALRLSVDFVKRSLNQLKSLSGKRNAFSTLMAIYRELDKPTNETTNDNRVVELFSRRMKINPEEARAFLRDSVFKIFPELKRHFFPVPGSKEFLDWAKDHYTLVLATNPVWPPEIVELRLNWAGIDPKLFRSFTHIRRMSACKPQKRYYQEILSQEGVRAEDCMLIGDDPKMDLPATNVGIRTFIVGDYARAVNLKTSKNAAAGYRGSYQALKQLLESAPASSITS